jgi:predicted CxxxxCH...CXXCH cytochrome family protein
MKRQYILPILSILVLMLFLVSCSDLKKDLPTAVSSGTTVHDAGWNDTASTGFHGRILKKSSYDVNQCVSCHSKQYTGGTSGVKCTTCHATYPHSAGWTNSTDTTYHGKHLLNQGFDMTECKQCHGATLSGGTSGESCFLCHAQYPHASGWDNPTDIASHGKYLKTQNWATTTCSTCHGNDLKGGISTNSCFTCHAQYPHPVSYAKNHPSALQTARYPLTQCQACHGASYNGGSVVDATVSCEQAGCHRDANGNLKSPEACNTCHGNFLAVANDTASWAPPKSLLNDTSPSTRSVGAHQQHLAPALMVSGNKVDCKECHIVPATVSAPGHLGASPAEVLFNGSLASLKTNNGAVIPTPLYNSANGKCSNTYCHGYFKNGNLTNAPIWNTVDGSQEKCGSCHGNAATGNPKPVSGPHQVYADGDVCQDCHYVGKQPTAIYSAGQWSVTDKAHHINGKITLLGTEQGF